MTDLPHRIENARPEDVRGLLEEAFEALFPMNTPASFATYESWYAAHDAWCGKDLPFRRFLDAGAFVDAALLLYVQIPERVPSDPLKAVIEALQQRGIK